MSGNDGSNRHYHSRALNLSARNQLRNEPGWDATPNGNGSMTITTPSGHTCTAEPDARQTRPVPRGRHPCGQEAGGHAGTAGHAHRCRDIGRTRAPGRDRSHGDPRLSFLTGVTVLRSASTPLHGRASPAGTIPLRSVAGSGNHRRAGHTGETCPGPEGREPRRVDKSPPSITVPSVASRFGRGSALRRCGEDVRLRGEIHAGGFQRDGHRPPSDHDGAGRGRGDGSGTALTE